MSARRPLRSPRRLPSPDELVVRGRQRLALWAERIGRQNPDRVSWNQTESALTLDRFRSRAPAILTAALADRAALTAAVASSLGKQNRNALQLAADRIVQGQFDLLGYSALSFGDPVDWRLDPLSGKRAPTVHWSRIRYLEPALVGDHKIIWELNRHQWFLTLARAWWLTDDDRYAHCFVHRLAQWMEKNPPKSGINWASSLEVALRAIAWSWALHLFRDFVGLTSDLFGRAMRCLDVHGRHIETYLSTYFSPNTHLTGEALGLVYLGTAFPELPHGARWRKVGSGIMLEMLGRHLRPDGTYFEQSSYYHRYTTDFYTHFYLLTRDTDPEVAGEVRPHLLALLDHLAAITQPDGTTPLFGDEDGGRLVALDERPVNDFRATLSTGAVLFGRPDFKRAAGEIAQETLWLLGPSAKAEFEALATAEPAYASRAFADGGLYVMRDGWRGDSNYLLVDCGPHGSLRCGHSHADALAVEVAALGRPVLVDAGTFTYTASPDLRDRFRSSAAHNTVTVDGESSSEPAGPFSWRRVARCTLRRWITQPRFDFFDGSHDGYARLPDPVTHHRAILFIKGDYWVMRDRFAAVGSHRCDLRFHFPADCEPVLGSVDRVEVISSSRLSCGLDIWAPGATGQWQLEEGSVSPCYGRRESAVVASLSLAGAGDTSVTTILAPCPQSGRAWTARRFEVTGGWAAQMDGRDVTDLILAGPARLAGTPAGLTDFHWAWLRRRHDGRDAVEWIGIDGRSFALGDMFRFRADRPVEWAWARWSGGELRIEFEPLVRAELSVGQVVSRLLVNGRETDRTGDEASGVTVHSFDSTAPDEDVRH